MISSIRKDVQAVLENDPAARYTLEVVLCYPGFHALCAYRVAHFLWGRKLKLLARIFSYFSRAFTGVEIHPAASIAPGVCIDHGMGVVIGETAVVESGVVIYQGVTLGGTGKTRGAKRHPTVRRDCVLGAHATILGDVTIGQRARVGACAVVLTNIPERATVVGSPDYRVIRESSQETM